MNKTANYLSLTACALAASLFLSGCGGGADAETAAPTVAISAAASGSDVLFTFEFSGDVGTTFTADDVSVSGGAKASTVTRLDATHYTLVVTPDSAGATVTATVETGKFSTVARTANVATSTAAYANVPTTAATIPPTREAGDVVSIYSDAYTPTAGRVFAPNWSQSTQDSEVQIAGNNTRKYSSFNYQGITFTPIDVSGMTKLHIDVWTPDLTALDVFILSGGVPEQSVQVTPTKMGWNSFDIDLAGYTNPNKAAIKEMKLVATGGSTMYFDNLYFYKVGKTSVACATGKTCIDFSASNLGFAPFNMAGGGSVTVDTDPADSSNKVMKFVKKSGDQDWTGTPIYTDLDNGVLTKGIAITDTDNKITLRIRSTAAAGEEILVKLEGGSAPATTEISGKTTKQNEWENLSFTMPNNGNYKSLVIFNEPGKRTSVDTIIYIDDIQYPTGASASVCTSVNGATVNLTDGKFSSGYIGSWDAKPSSIECGTLSKWQDSSLETQWWGGSTNTDNFTAIFGLKKTSVTSDSYYGQTVKAPQNGVANIAAFTKMDINLWGFDVMIRLEPTSTVILKAPAVMVDGNSCTPTLEKAVKLGPQIGLATYTLNLSDFTISNACGKTSSQILASGVTQVDVAMRGFNMNTTTEDGTSGYYGNGFNVGTITFK